jgi:hypothetical protein
MVQYTVFNLPSFSCGVYPVLPVGAGRVCISTEVLDSGHRALQKLLRFRSTHWIRQPLSPQTAKD